MLVIDFKAVTFLSFSVTLYLCVEFLLLTFFFKPQQLQLLFQHPFLA